MRQPVPILDPTRVKRPGRRIEWPVSRAVHLRFREWLHELVALEYADQTDPEVVDRMAGLRDAIRRLPGYPRQYDVERDIIVPVVTTVQR